MRVSYNIISYFEDKIQNQVGDLPKSTFILYKMSKSHHCEPQVELLFTEAHKVDMFVCAQYREVEAQ